MVERAQGCALRTRLTIPYLGVRLRRWGHITPRLLRATETCIASRRTPAIHRSPRGDAYEAKGSVERSWQAFPRFADVHQRNDFR